MPAAPKPSTASTTLLLSRWPRLAIYLHWLKQTRTAIFDAPLEPILHPTRWRLRWIGLFSLIGHPLLGWVWSSWLPQPWESAWLRGVMALLGLPLVLGLGDMNLEGRRAKLVFNLLCWLQLPLFFSWMYFCNSGNVVWLSSTVAMILIYYSVVDWRFATTGIALAWMVAWSVFHLVGPPAVPIEEAQAQTDAFVIGFSWLAGMTIGFSSANLRREQLHNTLTTMGIMAHELRTPLATVSLIADALQMQAQADAAAPPVNAAQLASRLQLLVRNMHHQIDTQIANARLLRLPSHTEEISAGQLLRECLENYPYRNQRERQCVELHVRRDFIFRSSQPLFAQVIDNLLKNALKALAATDTALDPGDLTLEVGILQNRGRIVISDRGVGIPPVLQQQIFEAFFSTDRGSGHGLGLAFCKRVVQSAHGSIRVHSEPGKGASFTIELPLAR